MAFGLGSYLRNGILWVNYGGIVWWSSLDGKLILGESLGCTCSVDVINDSKEEFTNAIGGNVLSWGCWNISQWSLEPCEQTLVAIDVL